MISLSSKVNLASLQKLGETFPKHAAFAIRQVAFSIEYDAKRNAPVDTGALKASIYTSTNEKSGYDNALQSGMTRARSLPFAADEAPQPESDLVAIIAVAAKYGPYVEFGTHKMAAQPFLFPAGQANREFFGEQIKEAFQRAARDAGATS